MDHIHGINQVIDKSAEYNQPPYVAFIDYKKALDSVEIPAVIKALGNQGVQEAHFIVFANTYKYSTTTFVLRMKSRKLPIKKGLRQGATVSPMLLTACLLEVFRTLDWKSSGVRVNGEYLRNLRFAGDIVLFSNTGDQLQQMIMSLNREKFEIFFNALLLYFLG